MRAPATWPPSIMRGRLSSLLQERRVGRIGHRYFVGGRWHEIGRLQLEFLRTRGLQSEHVFLDIGCGALRGGVHLIPYLDRGNYLGIDRDATLVRRGLSDELPDAIREDKQPEFVISHAFEFGKFSKVADISLAQSLFTHLTVTDIERCLSQLREYVTPDHEFYATFWQGDSARNPRRSDSLKRFEYSPDELGEIARRTAWLPDNVGEWGHPRGQMMMRFTPA